MERVAALGLNLGALIIRIGFWIYHCYNKDPLKKMKRQLLRRLY